MSPVIRSLIRDVERLKKSYQGLLGLKPLKIVADGDAAKINATASATERLAAAERRLRQDARKAAGKTGNAATAAYGAQGAATVRSMRDGSIAAAKAIQRASAAQQTASRVEDVSLARRLAGVRLTSRLMSDQQRQQDRAAAASAVVDDKVLSRRLSGLRLQSRLMDDYERQREHADRAVRSSVRNVGRVGGRAADAVQSFSNTAAIGAAVGGAAAAKIARDGISSRMEADTAETKARIFGGLNAEQVRDMRSKWLDQAALANGLKPAEAINAATEALKAGISPDNLRGVTESILRAGVGLELDVAETTKLVGRIATLKGSSDPKMVDSTLNAVAVSAKETAADSNEIVSALRRGAGALGASKMTPQELAAITASSISTGMEPHKAGTFMDYWTNEMVGARNLRGQRRMDFSQATSKLGLGSLENVSRRAANDPTKLLVDMLDRMGRLKGEDRAKIARAIGGREWQGELLQLFQGRSTLKSTLAAVRDPKNANFLSDAQKEKMSSMGGKLAQLRTVASLAWESVGVGLSDAFDRIVTFFTKIGSPDRFAAISAATRSAVDGLVKGLGFDNVTDLLESAFGGGPDKIGAFGKSLGEFFRGIGEGARAIVQIAKPVLAALGATDAASIGKLAVELVGLSLALRILRPLLSGFGLILDAFGAMGVLLRRSALALAARGIGGGIAASIAANGVGGALLGVAGVAGAALLTPVGIAAAIAAVTLGVMILNWDKITSAWDGAWKSFNGSWLGAGDKMDERPLLKQFWDWIGPNKAGASELPPHMRGQKSYPESPYKKSSLSSSVSDMANGFRSLGAEIEKANFRTALAAGRIVTTVDGASATSVARSIAPRNIPDMASALPAPGPVDAFGLGRRGIVGGDPSRYAPRIPRGVGASERGSSSGSVPGSNISPNYPNELGAAIRQSAKDLGISAEDLATMISFETGGTFDPWKKGPTTKWGTHRGLIQWGEPQRKKYGVYEGMPVGEQMQAVTRYLRDHGVKPGMNGMNVYAAINAGNAKKTGASDAGAGGTWGTVADKWNYQMGAHRAKAKRLLSASENPAGAGEGPVASKPGVDAKAIADMQTGDQQGFGKWTPGDLADTVPKPRSGAGAGGGMGGGGSSSGGPTQIIIQGHNRDPEALANQVQKRIDEQMKWRTHDVEFSL